MSMRCKQCGEAFPKAQPYSVFELRRSQVSPVDDKSLLNNVFAEDGGLFCSRKCLADYLTQGDRSGVFDLGGGRRL